MLHERKTASAQTEQFHARKIAEGFYEMCVTGQMSEQGVFETISVLKADKFPAAEYIEEFLKMLLDLDKRVGTHGRRVGESVYCTLESFRTKRD